MDIRFDACNEIRSKGYRQVKGYTHMHMYVYIYIYGNTRRLHSKPFTQKTVLNTGSPCACVLCVLVPLSHPASDILR